MLKQADQAAIEACRIDKGQAGRVTFGFTAVARHELIPDLVAAARTALHALREAEMSLTVHARELDRNAPRKAAREQSALAANQASELYRYGRTDFGTTLDVRRSPASANSALTAGHAQLASNQTALFLVLVPGHGWESPQAQGRGGFIQPL